ncbi:MAG: PIN domain-containing protein [Rhizonema sp. PD37]|nr:PIN domain-containing protein [Rhizonema sp. PD37]
MRVLLDTNIILDFLLERSPFFKDADNLFQAIASDQVEGYVTATTVTDIFYIVRKQTKSFELATEAVSTTLSVLEVYPVNKSILEAALASNLKDFEDAVQLTCASFGSLEAIITRDAVGFAGASLAILSVTELLKQLE